jgi:phytoene/squalene synthetase
MDLYLKNALKCSIETTNNYSTSFSLGVSLLDNSIRDAIYAIYGFVRFADEIVDTFYEHKQKELLNNFKAETFKAIEDEISTNPILHSFQWAVNKFNIEHHLINSFLFSMEMDLAKTTYSAVDYKTYIYGSAEVVGLMCLQVFCKGDTSLYIELIHPARKLGEAFQKVNFLRDIESDFEERGRTYFPNINLSNFTAKEKKEIEKDIENDFAEALIGISRLPLNARFGVYLAYSYYLSLLNKINKTPANILMKKRIRISNYHKLIILFKSYTLFMLRRGNIQTDRKLIYQKLIETVENKAYA